ncbi:MAG: BMC domain-containing protein [Desulfovibrio sp.]|nr:BMC domain-containing protein [Desulfovibrio sp.]
MQAHTAVGMAEYTSIAAGMEAADAMVKTADVRPLFFKTICPGKYTAAVSGDVAAVEAALQAARLIKPSSLADWFVIPNIHRTVISAIAGCQPIVERGSLGVIETYSVAAAIRAADAAVKAAEVTLMDVRMALGLGGKGYVLLLGDVAAVKASVNAGSAMAAESGLLVGTLVIARPAPAFFDQIL